MEVNFIALSGKVYNEGMDVYTKSGKKYNLYTLYSARGMWIRLLCRDSFPMPVGESVVIFGKTVNLYGSLGVLVVECKKFNEIKAY
ncbi:MAG: hypothetical protein ABDH28_04100 [Brevinematia bacterium]